MEDHEEVKVDYEAKQLMELVEEFGENGFPDAFDKAVEYISSYVDKSPFLLSSYEAIFALNASGKTVMRLALGEDADAKTVESIENLSAVLEQVNSKIDEAAKALESTIAIPCFQSLVTEPAKDLMHALCEIYKHRSQGAVDRFKAQYESHDALSIIDNYETYLSSDETNPLSLALRTNPWSSRLAVDQFAQCLREIYVGMCIALVVHEGVQGRDFVTPKQIRYFLKIYGIVSGWTPFIQSVEIDFWPGIIEDMMIKAARNYDNESNAEKAEHIKQQLERLHTTKYGFVIIVHDVVRDTHYGTNHAFVAEKYKSILEKLNDGGCCTFVYRTSFDKERTEEEVQEVYDQASKMKLNIFWDGPADEIQKNMIQAFTDIPNLGFLAAIKETLNAEVRMVGTEYKNAMSMDLHSVRSKTWMETIADFEFGDVMDNSVIVVVPRSEPSPQRRLKDYGYSRFEMTAIFD